jgi:hypothetical protein
MLLNIKRHGPMSSSRTRSSIRLESRIFMTEAELAARWRHSLRSLQRWRAEGNGPPYLRIGRRIVFRITDVEAFEARREVGE